MAARCGPGDVVLGLERRGAAHQRLLAGAPRARSLGPQARPTRCRAAPARRSADALLAPHRWYGASLLPLIRQGAFSALAHVTGGGIAGNLVRVIPEGCHVRLEPKRGRCRRWCAG